jgi:hypothetical protein
MVPADGTRELGRNWSLDGHRFSLPGAVHAVTASSSENPVTISSSWSMPPLPEDGSWAVSGISQSPEEISSSAMVAAIEG